MVVVMHDITNLKNWKTCVGSLLQMYLMSKTPITSIKGFAETLIEGAKNDEESLDMFLNIIFKRI